MEAEVMGKPIWKPINEGNDEIFIQLKEGYVVKYDCLDRTTPDRIVLNNEKCEKDLPFKERDIMGFSENFIVILFDFNSSENTKCGLHYISTKIK